MWYFDQWPSLREVPLGPLVPGNPERPADPSNPEALDHPVKHRSQNIYINTYSRDLARAIVIKSVQLAYHHNTLKTCNIVIQQMKMKEKWQI